MAERWHGTAGGYTNHHCRCPKCTEAWRVYARAGIDRWRARNLGKGLTAKGTPRVQPYDSRALALMERHGVTPDPRFV